MSKSATEQFQIKKKRKNNNNSSNYKSSSNNTNKRYQLVSSTVATTKAAATNKIVARYYSIFPYNNNNKNNYTRSYFAAQQPAPIIAANASTTTTPTKTYACVGLRDKSQVRSVTTAAAQINRQMPLSQGYYAKAALATKRGIKNAKLCGGLRDYDIAKVPRKSNSSENVSRKTGAAVVAAASSASPQQLLNNAALVGGGNDLQLSYLLGESLALSGNLQEAFDLYAIIASEQRDGCIPLERLNTLATSLIRYVRQLSNVPLDEQTSNVAEYSSHAKVKRLDYALETALKAKYAHRRHATWSAAAAAAAPHMPNTLLGAGSLDLNASSRELRLLDASSDFDALLCPLCRDMLRCPVTANCGHTFCRQCCETITMCNICHIKFPKSSLDDFDVGRHYNATFAGSTSASTSSATTTSSTATFYGNISSVASNNSTEATAARHFNSNNNFAGNNQRFAATATASPTTVTTTTVASTTATATTTWASTSSSAAAAAAATANNMKFMPDVLVRRLVEKWWGPDLQARKINETAASYMHLNLLDDALRFCNASLDKSSTNFKSLLLRAEVLRKLNHFQSSLADVENALKSRYTSAKAHYLRALALSELGRFEEALFDNCLAISLDKSINLTTSELFQHDLAKILQKLLASSPKSKSNNSKSFGGYTVSPYSVMPEHRWRRQKIALLSNANGDNMSSYDDENFVGKSCDIMVDVEDVLGGDVDYVGCTENRDAYADYDLAMRRQATRKHCRRKWMTKDTELMPSALSLDDGRCSAMFRSILERTQQEVQRLRKLNESNTQKQLVKAPTNLIDASDFDCVLCCRTFWKPVVTPCGHTYCWVCLDRCMDYSSSCPLCMSPLVESNVNMYQGSSSPVPFMLAKRPVTKFLEAAMKRFIPDSYAKRFRQEMDMEPSVPVFICTTAFPYVPCPLFVCEQRYRLMVRRAVESDQKQFGIVQPHSGKSRYFDVGTILDIRDCVLLGDGCSILSTVGYRRFKILARNEKDGYETAKVEYIYDEAISDENIKFVSKMHAAVLSKAIEWFESLSTELKQEILQSFGEMPLLEDNWESIADGPAWAWWIIALLPLSQQLKVDILATTSLEKRLRAIEKTLDCLSGTFRRTQQDCSVVVEHQQQQQCDDDDELTQICQTTTTTSPTETTDECCQRTSVALTSSSGNSRNSSNAEHSQLML